MEVSCSIRMKCRTLFRRHWHPCPAEKKRILAVVVRGSDYVYLATEDQAYPDLFLRSELKDRLLYVRPDKGDYTGEENHNKLLIDIYGQEKKDPYKRTILLHSSVFSGLHKTGNRRSIV